MAFYIIACVTSVSVGFGSKGRPRNGIFDILPAREMGREPKLSPRNSLLPNYTETLATQAIYITKQPNAVYVLGIQLNQLKVMKSHALSDCIFWECVSRIHCSQDTEDLCGLHCTVTVYGRKTLALLRSDSFNFIGFKRHINGSHNVFLSILYSRLPCV